MSDGYRFIVTRATPALSGIQRLKRRDRLSAGSLWRLHQGTVRVVTWNDKGDVMPLGFLGPGSWVGGVLAVTTPCEIQALTSVTAEQLSPLTVVPEAAFAAQARQATDLLKILHYRQVEERLLQLLCWLVTQLGYTTADGVCLPLGLTHQELADAIASTRVTVTRTLRQLELEGHLKWSRSEKVVFHSTLTQRFFRQLSA